MKKKQSRVLLWAMAILLLALTMNSCNRRNEQGSTMPSEPSVSTTSPESIPDSSLNSTAPTSAPTIAAPTNPPTQVPTTLPAITIPETTVTLPSTQPTQITQPPQTTLPTAPTETTAPTIPTPATEPTDTSAPVLYGLAPYNTHQKNPYFTQNITITISGGVFDIGSGLKELRVNGAPVTVKSNGKWSTEILLTPDFLTVVRIEAWDFEGNYCEETLFVYRYAMATQAYFSETDGSLRFAYCRTLKPGDTIDGRTVTEVYSGFEDTVYSRITDVPWHIKRARIEYVYFETEIEPISTMYWFADMLRCQQMDLRLLDTQNTVNMAYMFQGCSKLQKLDISSFSTDNVIRTNGMFENCVNLRRIYVSPRWSCDQVVGSEHMFANVNSIIGGRKTTYRTDYLDKTYARIDGGFQSPGYFTPAGQSGEGDEYELYVLQESNRMSQLVSSRANDNTISFILMSDMHMMASGEYPNFKTEAQVRESNLHAGQAAALIAQNVRIDFFGGLGDFAWGDKDTTIAQGIESIQDAMHLLEGITSQVDSFLIPGNHDTLYGSYDVNGQLLADSTIAELIGSYGYKDYDQHKIRVIYLNNSESEGINPDEFYGIRMSPKQLQWFAQTLDLSGKADAADWGILILSHMPLDWGNIMPAANMVQAYLEGEYFETIHEGVLIRYDFHGKNQAKIIANFHGHLHAYTVDQVHYFNNGEVRKTNVKRISIPNAIFNRNNTYGNNEGPDSYGIEYGQEETWEKTVDSAEDTAFCVVTIDLEKMVIYVDCYGAGYDREISYGA